MPLITKPNYNQIFASQAPDIDKPPLFNNPELGWAESRQNNGKPTIKQFNYLLQMLDLKSLWILQNGACLPYDATIEYASGSLSLKDGIIQQYNGTTWTAYRNETPYTLKYFTTGTSYPANAEITLTNGDKVKNVSGGPLTNDPNTDMTGWVNLSEHNSLKNRDEAGAHPASAILDESGRTQQEINASNVLRFHKVAIFDDFLTANEIANKSTTDLSSKLVVALNETGGNLKFIDGDYLISSPVVYTGNANLDWGANAYLKFSGTGSLTITGTATNLTKLSVDATALSKTLTVLDASQINQNDLICIFNPTDNSFGPWSNRPYYRAGEFLRVGSVASNVVSLSGRLIDSYLASAVDVYKIDGCKVTLKNPQIKAENSSQHQFNISLADGVLIEPWRNEGGMYEGLQLDRCYNFLINNPSGRNNSPINTTNYGIVLANCQNGRIVGGDTIGARHAISMGGGNVVCGVPCRQIHVSNATINTTNTLIGASDAHGNCEYITYESCYIDCANIAGANNTLLNCTINSRDDGLCYYASEILGGTFDFINCTLITNKTSGADGIVEFVINEQLKSDLTINIQNMTVKGPGGYAQATLVQVDVNVDLIKKVNVNIGGGTKCFLSGLASFLRIQRTTANSGSASYVVPSDFLIVDGVNALTNNAYLIYPNATSLAAKTRQQSQSGNVDLVVAASAAFGRHTDKIAFKYRYTKTPVAINAINPLSTVTVASNTYDPDYTTKTTGINMPVSGNAVLNNAEIRPCVFFPNKLSASLTLVSSWQVGINEV